MKTEKYISPVMEISRLYSLDIITESVTPDDDETGILMLDEDANGLADIME